MPPRAPPGFDSRPQSAANNNHHRRKKTPPPGLPQQQGRPSTGKESLHDEDMQIADDIDEPFDFAQGGAAFDMEQFKQEMRLREQDVRPAQAELDVGNLTLDEAKEDLDTTTTASAAPAGKQSRFAGKFFKITSDDSLPQSPKNQSQSDLTDDGVDVLQIIKQAHAKSGESRRKSSHQLMLQNATVPTAVLMKRMASLDSTGDSGVVKKADKADKAEKLAKQQRPLPPMKNGATRVIQGEPLPVDVDHGGQSLNNELNTNFSVQPQLATAKVQLELDANGLPVVRFDADGRPVLPPPHLLPPHILAMMLQSMQQQVFGVPAAGQQQQLLQPQEATEANPLEKWFGNASTSARVPRDKALTLDQIEGKQRP